MSIFAIASLSLPRGGVIVTQQVQELRARLTEQGLSTKGNKPELVARLIEHYQKEGSYY